MILRWVKCYCVQVIGVISVIVILGSEKVKVAESKGANGGIEYPGINCRKHSAVLTDFGGVGDGVTSNTKAFRNAISNLSHYASDGGAQLIVPPGKWLTGPFNLTSHFTLFLHNKALILASQVYLSANITTINLYINYTFSRNWIFS